MKLWDMTVGRLFAPKAEITTSQKLEDVFLSGLGVDTSAGVSVTPEKAMMVAAVSSAMGVISEGIAQLPLIVYRKSEDGKDRAEDHPLYDVLHNKPNTFQNSFEFREMMQMHLLGWGNCYAFINRANGYVRELLPIHPNRVTVSQDERWNVAYEVLLPNGSRATFTPDQIFHIRDRSLNGYEGLSRINYAKEAIGLSIKTEQHGAKLFGNGARPSGVLSTDQKLTPEQIDLLRQSWKSAHGGDNAMGTAVLDGGLKWNPTMFQNDDAQFLETRKFQLSEVSRIFRVPPHMIGDLERATFTNIEHQSLEFVQHTLGPWMKRWEMAINTQLINKERRGRFFCEFLVEGLLRGDIKTRYEAYQIGIQNGWLNPNEVREKENMNAREGGDEFAQAANIFGGGDEAETTNETGLEQDAAEAQSSNLGESGSETDN